MTRFPGNDFTDFEAPMRVEADIAGLEVIQGEVPEHLSGIYYRVVCDRQWPSPVEDDFFFNEDGMAMYFRFHKGRVDFRSRYVRTPRYQSENEAGRALFGAYRNPLTDDPSVQGMRRGLANTNVFFHGGKLYASKEDSPPLLLDPMTLETVGEDTFEGALTSETCTAHPKTDARTGEMVFFGYAAKGETTPDIAYYEADPSGKVVHEAWITPPYSSMVHDFAVTQNFVIFPIIPLRSEHEWLERGEPHFKWDPDKDVYLGVLPRKGTAKQLRWFRAPNRFASHIMGAHDDGRNIHIDTPVSTGNFFTFFPDVTGAPWDPDAARGYLSRWSVDMGGESDTFTERKLMPYPGEFPRMDDRYETLPYGWGVLALNDVPGQERVGGGFQWISTVDLTGKRAPQVYYAGHHCSVGEPLFVPGDDRAGQGQGYVFVVVGRHEQMRSDLVILDAQHLDAPPVATVALPIRLRRGLHGNWVSDSELRTRVA
ncbi:carotenoid cleavage dioxygenase [Lipingzhangella halophila]|uniref:Dioxygenase n=1 Tax=Lipingzhangella halophila TaxID=1783352 RepID=A0A7W7W337_9ACTN|nr:carotenoid oxygenase family protein [Lipingzhangella halophila]MBB4931335.1 carotenoid cleavage dioxygenase [Lipingzhangella halophila]